MVARQSDYQTIILVIISYFIPDLRQFQFPNSFDLKSFLFDQISNCFFVYFLITNVSIIS